MTEIKQYNNFYVLSVHIRNKEVQLNLFFNDSKRSQEVFNQIHNAMNTTLQANLLVLDDVGHRVVLVTPDIVCIQYTDITAEDKLKMDMQLLASHNHNQYVTPTMQQITQEEFERMEKNAD